MSIELIPQEPEEMTLPQRDVQDLHADVIRMGEMILRMGNLMGAMERRMQELEDKQRQITASHDDVKCLNDLINIRVKEICGKYALPDPGDERAIRAGIKRDIKKRYGIKDLHDVPEVALTAVQKQIDRWTDIRLIMKRRELRQEAGP